MAHNNNYETTVDEAATVDHLRALSAGIRLNEQPRRYPYTRRSWADRPDIVMRTINIAGRHTTGTSCKAILLRSPLPLFTLYLDRVANMISCTHYDAEIEYVRDWSRVVLTIRRPPHSPAWISEGDGDNPNRRRHTPFHCGHPAWSSLEAMSAAGKRCGGACMDDALRVPCVNYDLNNELLEDARAVNEELRAQNSRVNREFMNYRDGYPYDARESSNSSEEYYLP
ncbi:hypothetical protein PIB30_022552 [Stylosanthes scabra]|uniref:Uncharacterized protein n=1 Tax=Stylosanthes scabra TaxID=79078 RepID=A0ABU6X948_9FABA|nr:hypothetical protein [Stylosanthes scabra]